MPRLLVIHHSPTRGVASLTEAALAGTRDDAIDGVEVGAMKHVFDSTFLQVGGALDASGGGAESKGATTGRPYGLYVHGRYDTTDHQERAYELGATLAAVVGDR